MYPEEDEAPLTLSKLPFYLGDALLVGLAVTIAVLDGWKLDGVQVFACVLAVALGAALLALPFVTEYIMRVREGNEDRESESRLLKKQLERAEEALSKQQERLKKLESRSGLDDQRYELLTSAIDQKTQGESPDMTVLTERIKAIEVSEAKQAKVSDELKKELSAFEELFKESVNSLSALQSRLDAVEQTNQKSSSGDATVTPEEASEVSASRKHLKKADSSLLKRAMLEKQDTAATAVGRIIDPKSEHSTSDRETEAAYSTDNEDKADQSRIETQETVTAKAEEIADPEISNEIEALPEDFSVSLGSDLMVDDDFFGADETVKPEKSKSGRTKKTAAAENKKTSTKSPKATLATVTVDKLMGIGNKPFLRGSGAGLSWEKGVEMEFQEVGKWTWSVPAGSSEAIEVQVFRNDEDADRRGKQTLEPGQQLDISPEF
jgi:uncharacterized coiled-coil protein SlyX